MGFIRQCTNFVNRIDDSKEIGKDILNAKGNTVCIIHSSKGAGKSEFINKIQQEYGKKYKYITIKPMLNQSHSSNIQGQYIQEIFSSFICSLNDSSKFYHFIKTGNKELKEKALEFLDLSTNKSNLFSEIANILIWLLPIVVSFIAMEEVDFKKGVFVFGIGCICLIIVQSCKLLWKSHLLYFKLLGDAKKEIFLEKLCETISESAFSLQLSYIKYILDAGGYLIYLDNVELIDPKSLRGLAQCINCGSNCYPANYFLLEYTRNDYSNVNTFAESLQYNYTNAVKKDVAIRIYDLPPLSEEHIKEIAKEFLELTEEVENTLHIFWANEAQGNLISLIRHINSMSNRKNMCLSLEEKFHRMPKQRKFILLILIYSHGIEKADYFNGILEYLNKEIPYVEDEFTALCLDDFVEEKDGIYYCNPELIEQWKILYLDIDSIKFSAFSVCQRVLTSRIELLSLDKTSEKYRYIDNLFNLYLEFSPDRIVAWLSYITEYSKHDYNISYLRQVFAKLLEYYKCNETNNSKTLLNVVKSAYYLELYTEAMPFFELIFEESSEKIAYFAMLLYRIDDYEGAVLYCQKHYSPSGNTRLDFLLYQVELVCQRMLYNVNECWQIICKLQTNKLFCHYYEYGFFLRNLEIVVDVKESIKYLKKSMIFFAVRGDLKNTAISKLSYGMQLARIGRLKSAKWAIKRAQKRMINYPIIAQHYFYVDLASVLLLSQDHSSQIWSYLEQAELTAYTDFDRLVIITNQLAYCILSNDTTTFIKLLGKVEGGHLPYITQIYRSIYYNIAMMFQKSDNISDADKYLQKSHECHNIVINQNSNLPLNQLWDARYQRNPLLLTTKELKFMYQMPYHVSFISFWHFDVPDFS